jgi:peptidoglycan/LPS O-acetylase OafA/YrhL
LFTPARFIQLDALRALAVLAVMLSHFSESLTSLSPDFGRTGVRLFFVLSGFLITGILLRSRARIASGTATIRSEVRQFFIRRSLRIFPAFYAVLLVAALLDMEVTRATFWWHFFYGSNFFMAARHAWPGILSHFWSLAVEEQFYLIWPWLILLLPRRWLRRALILTCLVGPLSRSACFFFAPENTVALITITPSCLDLLGAGALLALLWHERNDAACARWRLFGLATLPVIALMLLCVPADHPAVRIFSPALQAFAFAAVIDGAARGFTGATGAFLTWRPLVWIGQISYGLYLTHNFAHWLAPRLLRQLTHYRLSYFPSETLHIALLLAISFAAATASWYLIERPFNRLKDRLAAVS